MSGKLGEVLPPCPILYEDNHLLVVSKPALLPTMGSPAGVETLHRLFQQYLKQKHNKPGNVYLGIMSRLDAPVTGVVVMARTSKAARRMTEQFRAGAVEKTYWAIVDPPPQPIDGELRHQLRKHVRHRKVELADANDPNSQQARLTYHTLASDREIGLLEVRLETGRKHQIRVQLSAIGSPILGDRKYASRATFPSGIALHSRRIQFIHPVRKTPLDFTAAPPPSWQSFTKLTGQHFNN